MPDAFPRLSPLVAGLTCRCPRCGQGRLFDGFLRVARRCERCGLDYGFAEPADGPAFFVMTGVGIVVIALFAWIEIGFHPPLWVHAVSVFPLLILGCLGSLRPVKAWLVASQYVHKAEQGRFEPAEVARRRLSQALPSHQDKDPPHAP